MAKLFLTTSMLRADRRFLEAPPPRLGCALAAAILLAVPGTPVQAAGSYGAAVTPVYQFDSDLDSGGTVGYSAVFTSLRGSWEIGARSTLGVGLSFDYEDWRFDGVAATGGIEPWDRVTRIGLSVPYRYTTDGGWRLTLAPALEFSGETGAQAADGLEYGALVSAARAIRPGLTLGVGVGVYDRIDEVRAFPLLILDWRIGEHLRLTNPLAAGPSGPAGLEIVYALDSGWELGLAAAYRSFRFRLDDQGPLPNGIGENQNWPLVVRLGKRVSDTLSFNAFAGTALAGNLSAEDETGHRVYDLDRDPAPLLGLSLSLRL